MATGRRLRSADGEGLLKHCLQNDLIWKMELLHCLNSFIHLLIRLIEFFSSSITPSLEVEKQHSCNWLFGAETMKSLCNL